MSAPRFFVDPAGVALAASSDVVLPDAVARHATQVLRLRAGDAIVLFDGRGGEYAATLRVEGRRAGARVGAHRAIEREPLLTVTLAQAVVAVDIMDWIVRKAVELGAAAVTPVVAARSQGGAGERVERRLLRWQQIAIAACEQCGRNRVPAIAPPVTLDAWLQASSGVVVLDPRAPLSLSAAVVDRAPGAVLVGPEGGFSAEELRAALARGARAVHMGPRTLRAETAALAALATIAALCGDAR